METINNDEKSANDKPWLFKKGNTASVGKGRPKGTFSLKTFARKYLEEMTDEQKLEFMEGLPKEVIWKMSEGMPKQDTESKVEVTMVEPLLGGNSNVTISSNNRNKETPETQEED